MAVASDTTGRAPDRYGAGYPACRCSLRSQAVRHQHAGYGRWPGTNRGAAKRVSSSFWYRSSTGPSAAQLSLSHGHQSPGAGPPLWERVKRLGKRALGESRIVTFRTGEAEIYANVSLSDFILITGCEVHTVPSHRPH